LRFEHSVLLIDSYWSRIVAESEPHAVAGLIASQKNIICYRRVLTSCNF
jgi:hypothetical protein